MSLTEDRSAAQVLAWQVDYATEALPGKTPLAVINRPRAAWAYARRVDGMAALADDATSSADANGFTFVFVQSGSATPYEAQRQAERWMASRPGELGGIIEILFHSERLLWRRGRALCFGTHEAIDEMLAAVTHFSFGEGDLRRLEQQVEDVCTTMRTDIQLTDKMSWWKLRSRPHVDVMTRTATDMQVGYLRTEKALEEPAAEISGAARRVFIELTLLAMVRNRLLRVREAAEAINQHYRFINERFSEYAYFLRQHRFIVLILLVLVIEWLIASQDSCARRGTISTR